MTTWMGDRFAVGCAAAPMSHFLRSQILYRFSKSLARSTCEPVWPSGKALSPFLTGRMFVREPSWKFSAKLAGS